MSTFLSFQNPNDIACLKNIKAIYTDVDGTLLAPGGSVLRDSSGAISYKLPEKLCALQNLGIKIILISGRNKKVLHELSRLFNFDGYISELGSVIAHKTETGYASEYFLGDFEFDASKYENPFQQVLASKLPEVLIQEFPNRLEHSMPYALERSVTQSMWGNIDEDRAREIIEASGLDLEFVNNGIIHPKEHGLKLSEHDEIYIYHLVPRGVSKASALEKDMKRRGYTKDEVIALGDSPADAEMAHVSGHYVVMKNALVQKEVSTVIEDMQTPPFLTSSEYVDGWCEFADALLQVSTVSH